MVSFVDQAGDWHWFIFPDWVNPLLGPGEICINCINSFPASDSANPSLDVGYVNGPFNPLSRERCHFKPMTADVEHHPAVTSGGGHRNGAGERLVQLTES